MRRRKAKLARGFLLKRGCGEGRRWIAGQRLCFDRHHRKATGLDRGPRRLGIARIANGQALNLPPLMADKTGRERHAILLHLGRDRPIFLRPEQLNLTFPIHDQPQSDRLNAPGRFRAGQFAPQHRRQGEADQIVERPARAIGINQVVIQFPRFRHCFGDGRLGDRVEGDALNMFGQHLFLRQHFLHVPANRFAFAIRVRREDQRVGGFGFIGNRLELLALIGIGLPGHLKAIIRVNRAILGWQIPNMPKAGQHPVTGAQIFLNRLCLGGRFYNNQLHNLSGLSSHVYARGCFCFHVAVKHLFRQG